MYHLLIGGHYSMVFEHFRNSFDLEDLINNFFNLFILCSYIVAGCFFEIIFQILGIVWLLTLVRPSKGIWPISMGEVLYWLVNKFFVFSILQHFFNSFISLINQGAWYLNNLKHASWIGGVASRHCKCFQQSFWWGHFLKALSNRWLVGPTFPIYWNLLCYTTPLIF
jgi:hypothetical protein